MKFRKNWKRFWTLDRHHAEGFTLVELIVVIAILAILAGVGTVGYSGYVKKANIAADEALVNEVKNALALEYYSNPDGLHGIVVLSPTVAPDCGEDEALEEALTAVFGEGWENREDLRLKYDGWSAIFQGSNFYNEQNGLAELLGTVDGLTDALGAALDNATIADALTGGAFASYVDELGANTTEKKADAAVFYVADATGKVSSEDLQNATSAMLAVLESGGGSEECLAAMNSQLNSTLASTAALYALAEGYANYYDANYETEEGKDSPRDILTATTAGFTNSDGTTTLSSAADAYSKLMAGFNQMGVVNYTALSEYMNKYMAADISAYAEAMKMVSAAKGSILNNNGELGSANYFSTAYINNLISAYAEGGIFVYVLEKDGALQITSSIETNEE